MHDYKKILNSFDFIFTKGILEVWCHSWRHTHSDDVKILKSWSQIVEELESSQYILYRKIFQYKRTSICHLWRHNCSVVENIHENTVLVFPPASCKHSAQFTVVISCFSIPILKTLSVKNLTLRKIPISTFWLKTFFAQEKKNEKMHHWILHKILHEKDCIVNFSKFSLGWPKFLQDYNTSTAFIVIDGFNWPCYFF